MTAKQLDLKKWEDLVGFKVANFVEVEETNNEDFHVNIIEEIEVVAFNLESFKNWKHGEKRLIKNTRYKMKNLTTKSTIPIQKKIVQ